MDPLSNVLTLRGQDIPAAIRQQLGIDYWGDQDDIKSIADDVIHQNEEQVQSILEQDDIMRMSGSIKLCRENISEQLDLLEQYSRSGNCDPGCCNLKEKMNKCLAPLIQFRLQR